MRRGRVAGWVGYGLVLVAAVLVPLTLPHSWRQTLFWCCAIAAAWVALQLVTDVLVELAERVARRRRRGSGFPPADEGQKPEPG